jgi:hypothetical protein
MTDYLEGVVPFLERLEQTMREMLEDAETEEITMNPEVMPEGVLPVGCDVLIGRRLLRISGEKRPDMYMWTESWLTAYLFVACGYCRPIEQIQILHPFHGITWSFGRPDLMRAMNLYERLLKVWDDKQS